MEIKVKKMCFSGTCIDEIKELKTINMELLDALKQIKKASKEHIDLCDDTEKIVELVYLHNIAENAIIKAEGVE